MLKKIRNLSSNPVILVLFGMLIFVFIFFFGMPSQGSLADGAQVFNEWSVRVQDEEIKVREGNLYAIRRDRNSSNNDLSGWDNLLATVYTNPNMATYMAIQVICI